jgi:ATP-binding cassette subfamily B protein/ATP-binding cassette subfamily C protein
MKATKKLSMFLSLAWDVSPSYIFLLLGSSLVGGAQLIVNVMLPKFLIDELIGAQRPDVLFLYTAFIVGANLAFSWLTNIFKRCGLQKALRFRNAARAHGRKDHARILRLPRGA